MKEIESIFRVDLCSFIEKSFTTLNPGVKYLHNWHIEKIAEKLQGLTEGRIKRLIINIPPRYMKSICCSVAWPAWLLGHDPTRRIIVASHSNNLSVKHSLDTRLIMQSNWYKQSFPEVKFAPDQNEKAKFTTSSGGFRLAASVGGGLTGEGGNFLIVDDPLIPEKALCKSSREQVIRWFDQTFSTRLDNKRTGVIIIVMQRLHEEDLAGILLERAGWELLSLPVISENEKLLHEEREGWDEINQLRADMGEYAFASQYLQKPYALEGGIIKRQWLQYYDGLPVDASIYQSWDTAIKTSSTSDYSVCITFAECENGYYILDVLREKLSYPDLKREFLALAKKWRPDGILVEDKASGQSLIQDLRVETTLPIIAQNPREDKLTRLAAVSPIIEAGSYFYPHLVHGPSC